jgi:hypothetical protein
MQKTGTLHPLWKFKKCGQMWTNRKKAPSREPLYLVRQQGFEPGTYGLEVRILALLIALIRIVFPPPILFYSNIIINYILTSVDNNCKKVATPWLHGSHVRDIVIKMAT